MLFDLKKLSIIYIIENLINYCTTLIMSSHNSITLRCKILAKFMNISLNYIDSVRFSPKPFSNGFYQNRTVFGILALFTIGIPIKSTENTGFYQVFFGFYRIYRDLPAIRGSQPCHVGYSMANADKPSETAWIPLD